MKVNRKEFQKTLALMSAGIAANPIIEQSSHFVFTGEKIFTYNDQLCVVAPLESEFKCSIPAKEFYKIVSKARGDDLTIIFKNNVIKFKSGKMKGQIKVLESEDLHKFVKALNIDAIDEWKDLPENFNEGLYFCLFSASKDVTLPHLSSLNITNKQIISTDDLRISEFTLSEDIEDEFLLPSTSIEDLIDFAPEEYSLANGWAYFRSNEVIFCSRIVQADFPEIKDQFNFESSKIKLPKKIQECLEAAAIMADGDNDLDKKVKVKIKDKKMIIEGNTGGNWIKDSCRINYSSEEEITFIINPKFLQEVCEKTSEMYYGDDRIMFSCKNFRHLVALYQEEEE